MGFRALVVAAATAHFAFMAYVIFGGFLGWRWPGAIGPHLAAVCWGLVGTLVPLACPLTATENWARGRAGEPLLRGGFIDHYLTGVVYPEQLAGGLRFLALSMALLSCTVATLRWRRRRIPRRRDLSVTR
ncbi:DUF2784 domain-containing protein [Actinopolymorpha sp. B11F2]|uniref:DUF2784 domain-containing protein n=1 Tax=Actinopolymorpha sp. B11F2 TaxID=3160862 RepID=UPI0032E48F7D